MSASQMHSCIGTSLAYTRPTFSETVVVFIRVSKLGCTELFSAGGENKQFYYRDVLLT